MIQDEEEAIAKFNQLIASKNLEITTAEYDAATKGRQIELEAIGAAIKILNDDDALDLFKKTLPSPSLVQTGAPAKEDTDPAASVWESVSNPVSFVQRAAR